MASKYPELPAMPGYMTRQSGYANIQIRDPYATGTQGPNYLGQFADFAEAWAGLKKVELQNQRREDAKAAAKAERDREKAAREKLIQDEKRAAAWAITYDGTFSQAVKSGDLHPTQSPQYWATAAQIMGQNEAAKLQAQLTADWDRMVQEGHERTLDPEGYKEYLKEAVGSYTETNYSDNPDYVFAFTSDIGDFMNATGPKQESEARERNFVKVSNEGISFIVNQMHNYSVSADPAAKATARNEAQRRLQNLYNMHAVNDNFTTSLGKQLVDAIFDSPDIESAEEFVRKISTNIPSNKLVNKEVVKAYYNSRKEEIKAAAEKQKTTNQRRFWGEWDTSIKTVPSDIVRSHYSTPDMSRIDALKSLEEWYENQWTALHEEFGLVWKESGGRLKEEQQGPAAFEAARRDLKIAYAEAQSRITYQQQVKIKVEPTVKQLTQRIEQATNELMAKGQAAQIDLAANVRSGPSNYRSMVEQLYLDVEEMVNPVTINADREHGKVFTKEEAVQYVDDLLYNRFYANPDASPEQRAMYIQHVGMNNSYVLRKVGKNMNMNLDKLLSDSVLGTRARLPRNVDPFDPRPVDAGGSGVKAEERRHSTLMRDLPRGQYEYTLEDLEGSPAVEAFKIYTHLRDQLGDNAAVMLGLNDADGVSDIGQIFDTAYHTPGPTPAHKLLQAHKRGFISNRTGPKPMTTEAEKVIGSTLAKQGVRPEQMNIVSNAVQAVWSRISEGDTTNETTARVQEWVDDNVVAADGYLRVGHVASFPAFDADIETDIMLSDGEKLETIELDEKGFFKMMRMEIAAQLWPRTERGRTDFGNESLELMVVPMGNDYMVIPQIKRREADGTFTLSDILERGIKAAYSADDIEYMY